MRRATTTLIHTSEIKILLNSLSIILVLMFVNMKAFMLMLFLEQAAGNHLIIAGDLVPEGTSLVTPDVDGVKMLEITPMFQWCTTNIFLHTSMGVERGYEFENFSNKALFSVSSGKKQVSRLLAPTLEKLLKKSTSGPPWRKRPDAHAHKHAKLHHFCKKLC